MSSCLALKTRIYQQNIHKAELKTLYFNFVLLLQNRFLLSRGNERLLQSGVSRTVNQLIMRVRKPKVEDKLVLQEKPQGNILTY